LSRFAGIRSPRILGIPLSVSYRVVLVPLAGSKKNFTQSAIAFGNMKSSITGDDLGMGWLQLVDSLKLQVSFAKEPYIRDGILAYSAEETYNFKEPTNRSQPSSRLMTCVAHKEKQSTVTQHGSPPKTCVYVLMYSKSQVVVVHRSCPRKQKLLSYTEAVLIRRTCFHVYTRICSSEHVVAYTYNHIISHVHMLTFAYKK